MWLRKMTDARDVEKFIYLFITVILLSTPWIFESIHEGNAWCAIHQPIDVRLVVHLQGFGISQSWLQTDYVTPLLLMKCQISLTNLRIIVTLKKFARTPYYSGRFLVTVHSYVMPAASTNSPCWQCICAGMPENLTHPLACAYIHRMGKDRLL